MFSGSLSLARDVRRSPQPSHISYLQLYISVTTGFQGSRLSSETCVSSSGRAARGIRRIVYELSHFGHLVVETTIYVKSTVAACKLELSGGRSVLGQTGCKSRRLRGISPPSAPADPLFEELVNSCTVGLSWLNATENRKQKALNNAGRKNSRSSKSIPDHLGLLAAKPQSPAH